MKARLLKKLLSNTGYIVANHGKYIGVGSPLCHDLIKVEKDTLALTYALDRRGRVALEEKSSVELRFIWDTLQDLIDSGELRDILDNDDVLENPLPVFTCNNGVLVETTTDAYGWPNLTVSGEQMYNNSYFPSQSEAIEYGVREMGSALKFAIERRQELVEEVEKVNARIADYSAKGMALIAMR